MAELQLSKYFIGEVAELQRSQIKGAEYNPRTITDENIKTLKRGIKELGFVGGLVVNKHTNENGFADSDYIIVGGHQRIGCLDQLQKYNPDTQENDYLVRVEVISVDEKKERELVVLLNNPNAQGQWDYDALREIIPTIDTKVAGLTDADLSMIGVDFLYQTEQEQGIADELGNLMMPVDEQHKAELAAKAAQREALKETPEWQDRVQHMKDVKREVKETAMQKAADADAYIVLSFDNYQNLQAFKDMMQLPADAKFIKGETLMSIIDPDGMGVGGDEE